MMKYYFMSFLMLPLVNAWWLFMLLVMLFTFVFVFSTLPFGYFVYLGGLSFGLDMISYVFVGLTCWLIFLMVLASFTLYKDNNNPSEFLMTLVIMLLALILTFSTNNLLLFYVFFEMSLIPTILLIFGWGYQPERLKAGYYLLFYTLFGSLPLLLGIFYVYFNALTLNFDLINLYVDFYLYLALLMAFLFKMPMVFIHFWLPKAHVEAPISGSMALAGVLLKLGGYGLIRVFTFIYPYSLNFNYFWLVISLYGSVLIGLFCLCQVDIKSLIAYSSVSHMALVICAIMTMNIYGLWGSIILMLGHGFCSSALFCLANFVYERSYSRSLMINKGFISLMPHMALLWFLLSVNNMAAPPSLNLLGEILIINSLMGWCWLSFPFLILTSFFSCCYSMYLYSVIHHGPVFSGLHFFNEGTLREYLLILLHWIPLNFLVLGFDILCP